MRVLVLGSGVIGVCTAWFLARAGHAVTVVDRQPAAGLETSFANAGEITPSFVGPWAGPGMPLKALTWMMRPDSPLVIRPQADPAQWRWLMQFLGQCSERRQAVNRTRLERLGRYSLAVLGDLRRDLALDYDARQRGTLVLLRTAAQVEEAARDAEALRARGIAVDLLDADGCIAREPGLAHARVPVAGGLLAPGDETGDCLKFTQGLAAQAAEAGVTFLFGTTVTSLETEGGAVTAVHTTGGLLRPDAVVAALGSHTPRLLAPLGLRVPVYPVKGYSVTVPVLHHGCAPESTVEDVSRKVAITRLGDRIRVGGTAQLSGYDLTLPESRRVLLESVLEDLFPGAGDLSRTSFWTGLRPMTPFGTPLIGRTRLEGLWLATGHGTLGWTMAAGTGRLLADLMSGRTPDIDPEGFGPERPA